MKNDMDDQLFEALEDRLAACEPKEGFGIRRDRWPIAVMCVGMAMTVPSILGTAGMWLGRLTVIGVAVELIGLAVFSFRQIRDVAPEFVDAKRKFAAELDRGFSEREQVFHWLRSIPSGVRARRLAYIESRLASMDQRYPLVFGAADKLGLLPVLAALFLQLQAIKTVSVVSGLVGFLLFGLYGMALWMARFRLQMQTYARLLKQVESD